MLSASTESPADCLLWQNAFAAKYDGIGEFGRADWDQLLGHCQVSESHMLSKITFEVIMINTSAVRRQFAIGQHVHLPRN